MRTAEEEGVAADRRARGMGAKNPIQDHKSARIGLSLDYLMRYMRKGNGLLLRIMEGDETWVHHFIPEYKIASLTRSIPVHQKKKSEVSPSAGRVKATVLRDEKVDKAVRQFLVSQGTEYYKSGFFKLTARYEKCLIVSGDYVEK